MVRQRGRTGCSDTTEETTVSDATWDRLEGSVDEATGKGKSALGDLTGDDQTQAEGQKDQAVGEAKQGIAGIKDKVDDVVKNLTDR